jgi:MoxR-like ATPase
MYFWVEIRQNSYLFMQRQPAEIQYAEELSVLKQQDNGKRAPNWHLSPIAVVQYIMGGQLPNGFYVTPKYIGQKRLIEIAVATLTTDRALLLYGLPGTAKSWVSEHLSAAISGTSLRLVQGTAGISDDAIRYGWNYARLLAEGPSEAALVASPVMHAMRQGEICRIEELTRIGSDVQDALITLLSEKLLPIPELNTQVHASEGFNIIATANNRDKGVNELSGALKRRFNTVILPTPDTAEAEIAIVKQRVAESARHIELPPEQNLLTEIQRVVALFRELRQGVTEDGRNKIKSPSGTLSTAEAISVVNSGLALATHFGNGTLCAEDMAAGITGAIVKDPLQDRNIWNEYLETVMRPRENWKDMYEACKELL